MTQQPTARRGARPLALLACALLALCTASCAPFFGGSMTPSAPPGEIRRGQILGVVATRVTP